MSEPYLTYTEADTIAATIPALEAWPRKMEGELVGLWPAVLRHVPERAGCRVEYLECLAADLQGFTGATVAVNEPGPGRHQLPSAYGNEIPPAQARGLPADSVDHWDQEPADVDDQHKVVGRLAGGRRRVPGAADFRGAGDLREPLEVHVAPNAGFDEVHR